MEGDCNFVILPDNQQSIIENALDILIGENCLEDPNLPIFAAYYINTEKLHKMVAIFWKENQNLIEIEKLSDSVVAQRFVEFLNENVKGSDLIKLDRDKFERSYSTGFIYLIDEILDYNTTGIPAIGEPVLPLTRTQSVPNIVFHDIKPTPSRSLSCHSVTSDDVQPTCTSHSLTFSDVLSALNRPESRQSIISDEIQPTCNKPVPLCNSSRPDEINFKFSRSVSCHSMTAGKKLSYGLQQTLSRPVSYNLVTPDEDQSMCSRSVPCSDEVRVTSNNPVSFYSTAPDEVQSSRDRSMHSIIPDANTPIITAKDDIPVENHKSLRKIIRRLGKRIKRAAGRLFGVLCPCSGFGRSNKKKECYEI